ncbi:subtilisin-like protease [Zingiber officinale]|uniref:subtilisin-like protease n=1 Tax=Zingiber officinale TaxID=94328 RepID=UPI001C4BA807|nr:subtilisin-like protease [Zingiber officinale]
MEILKASSFLCLIALFHHLLSHPYPTNAASPRSTYIIHVRLPTTVGASFDRQSWYKSFVTAVTSESHLLYSYTNVMSGFAARLTESELALMSLLPGFVGAHWDPKYQLLTTHTPDFLGLNLRNGIWNQSNYGKGIIVGLLDTGIFPDHPSFRDAGMPSPPAKWKGSCDFNVSSCNNKLIGARTFLAGSSSAPPIDEEGHGTHTASTAAGAFVSGAQVLGNALGTAAGIAPMAHIAMYKVCGPEDCSGSDILAAMDAAVSDGVDVLSLSLGGASLPFYADPIAVGAYGAIEKGVFVSCAGGNSGPSPSTLSNEAPWILTVAASTMDRSIRVTVSLGNGKIFDGESLYQPQVYTPTQYPLVYAGALGTTDAAFCGNGSLDGVDVKGKIVLCDRGGGIARIEKGATVQSAGGVGMILANQEPDGYSTLADAHFLPASHVGFVDGDQIKAYINSTANPAAGFSFKGTVVGTSPAPAITSFSSRGPNAASPGILKPDVTGPGVSVLAAWPFAVGPPSSNATEVNFNIISGTSMSTPHLSGIAALIKAAHPDWSPAAIKSAIMTTATVFDRNGSPISNEQHRPADLFALGAGHVDPVRATNPGLVYDLSADDYIGYLCGLGYSSVEVTMIARRPVVCKLVAGIAEKDLNYPSISVVLGGNGTNYVTVQRKVKNVGSAASSYMAMVAAPQGVEVRVTPSVLHFKTVGQEMEFQVEFSNVGGTGNGGYLKWVSSKYVVTSPISVTYHN